MKKSILLIFLVLLLVGCEKENEKENIVSCSGSIFEGDVEINTTFTGYFDNDDKLYDAIAILDIPEGELRNIYCGLADITDEDDISCDNGIVTINHYLKYYSKVNETSLEGMEKMNFEAMLEEALKGKFTCTK